MAALVEREKIEKAMKQKSAKDMAFEKERGKFRSEIRTLEARCSDLQSKVKKMEDTIRENEETIRKQADWIERLLAYTDISEDEMKKLVSMEKDKLALNEHFRELFSLMGGFVKF